MDRISVDRGRENILHKSAQIRHGIVMQIDQKEWWKSNWNNWTTENKFFSFLNYQYYVIIDIDSQKSLSSDFIWRGTKDISYLIGANFTSLRASSPFGRYHEKYTRERHARGDATAGGGHSHVLSALERDLRFDS